MSSTGDYMETARPLLAALVDGAERGGSTRMEAYGRVGTVIGRSSRWVRAAIGRQGGLALAHGVARRIEDALIKQTEAEIGRLEKLLVAARGSLGCADTDAAREAQAAIEHARDALGKIGG